MYGERVRTLMLATFQPDGTLATEPQVPSGVAPFLPFIDSITACTSAGMVALSPPGLLIVLDVGSILPAGVDD